MSSMHGDVQVTCRQAVQFVSEFVCFVYNSTFSCLCFWSVVLYTKGMWHDGYWTVSVGPEGNAPFPCATATSCCTRPAVCMAVLLLGRFDV
jgi:hypothetical protein